jgi:hypothetical protein
VRSQLAASADLSIAHRYMVSLVPPELHHFFDAIEFEYRRTVE